MTESEAKETMPADHVWLGRGGDFETGNARFEGFAILNPVYDPGEDKWTHDSALVGSLLHLFYCAHKDSEIVKLNPKTT